MDKIPLTIQQTNPTQPKTEENESDFITKKTEKILQKILNNPIDLKSSEILNFIKTVTWEKFPSRNFRFILSTFQKIINNSTLKFNTEKDTIIDSFSSFLIQKHKEIPKDLSLFAQKFFIEIFIYSLKNPIKIKSLFCSYSVFFNPDLKKNLTIIDQLILFYLTYNFPEVSFFIDDLTDPLSKTTKDFPSNTINAQDLGKLLQEIFDEVGKRDDFNPTNNPEFSIFSKIEYLQKKQPTDDDYHKEIEIFSCLIKYFHVKIQLENNFLKLNTSLNYFSDLEKKIFNPEDFEILNQLEENAKKNLIKAHIFFSNPLIAHINQNNTEIKELIKKFTILAINIQSIKFTFSSLLTTTSILAEFSEFTLFAKNINNELCAISRTDFPAGTRIWLQNGAEAITTDIMPGSTVSILTAGYTAAMMLLGQMNTENKIYEAIFRAISRSHSIIQSNDDKELEFLKEHLLTYIKEEDLKISEGDRFSPLHLHALADLIEIHTNIDSSECSFEILKSPPHKSWEKGLLLLKTQKRDDQDKIAAIFIKNRSPFSIMITDADTVQITVSHSSFFSNKQKKAGAFSMTFSSITDASYFLSSLYPEPPETFKKSDSLRVNFIPVSLPQRCNLKFTPCRDREEMYLIFNLSLIESLRRLSKKPQSTNI